MKKIKFNKKIIGSFVILIILSVFLIVGMIINRPKVHKVKEEDIFVEAPVSASVQKTETKIITVYINGEVKNPGVFKLKQGSIIDDLVKAAGGLTQQANIGTKVNLAKKLKDEDYIYIDKILQGNDQNVKVNVSSSNAVSAINSDGKVNINIASMEELDKLPGVGPVTAQKILDYREKNGEFNSIEDLKNIQGIGDKTLDKFRDNIDIR